MILIIFKTSNLELKSSVSEEKELWGCSVVSCYVWKTFCLQIDQAIRRKLTIYCQRELVLAFYIPLEVYRRFGEHLYQDMEFHLDEMKFHAVIMDAR